MHRQDARPPGREALDVRPLGEIVERILAGKTAAGLPEVRLDVGQGALKGAQLALSAGPRGVELTILGAALAARSAVERQLAELVSALTRRGVRVARAAVVERPTSRRP